MKKILILMVFVALFTGPFVFAEMNYLNLGKDAIAPGKFDTSTERLIVIREPLLVETVGKSGKQYKGYLPTGTELVCVSIEKGLRPIRIYYCGNPILNQLYLQESICATAPAEIQKPAYREREYQYSGDSDYYYRPRQPEPVRYDGNQFRQGLTRAARGYSLGAGIKQKQYSDAGYALERVLGDEGLFGDATSIISTLIGVGIGYGTTDKPKEREHRREHRYYYYNGSGGSGSGLPDF